ncbi:histidine phosphatase family protein [Lentilactobacillus kefiri]|uniref:histidine phosphatase family protein n=1 Tax=Lentilactobacillus kefiri TaxID=33962 RepID=UPI0024683F92|nr:histidine phosphatase family protein [Lentilactobacillus kefiri]MDH5109634.1 histidine phosphatase family protein [Lentilactobacillus kefiri]
MKLLITRHGETQYNKEKKYYGRTDIELDGLGLRQARELADKLKATTIDYAIRSDLKRTQQTMDAIMQYHPQTKQIIEKDIDEMPFGIWEGLNADQVEARDPTTWAAWLQAPFDVTPAGAEPYRVFEKRVTTALDHYRETLPSNSTLLVVAHQGVLRTLYRYWTGGDFWSVDFKAGCYSVFETGDGGVSLVSLND